jgi:DNA-binding response OmpR family regulator
MNKVKVLIVEDEAIVAMDIKNALVQLDYTITNIVDNIDDTLKCININEPDIILMDISINGSKDGIETVESIYKIKYIPVVYLTAFDDVYTINRAIQTDPVGYLVKPFNRTELNATLLLGLYKSKKNQEKFIKNNELINLGYNYYFDTKEKNLYYKNSIIKLGIKEKNLLNLLVQENGQNVSFKSIENEVWEARSVSNDSIRNMVSRLRNKMDYRFIQSVPYFGFKLIKIEK